MLSSSEFSNWCVFLQRIEPSVGERLDFHLTRLYTNQVAASGVKFNFEELQQLPWHGTRKLGASQYVKTNTAAELQTKVKASLAMMARASQKKIVKKD
jgi:hypothetical protein